MTSRTVRVRPPSARVAEQTAVMPLRGREATTAHAAIRSPTSGPLGASTSMTGAIAATALWKPVRVEPWTVAIVGAGPSGAAAAMAACARNPDASVLLLDREGFPRDKACGDGIAPHVLGALDRFGLAAIIDDYQPTTELELATRQVSRRRTMQQPLRAVPRTVFDARLVEAAVARGAIFERRNVRKVEVRDAGVLLDGEILARTVVAADGVESVVRRQLGIPLNPDGHMALALRGLHAHPVAVGQAHCAWTGLAGVRLGVPNRRRHVQRRLRRGAQVGQDAHEGAPPRTSGGAHSDRHPGCGALEGGPYPHVHQAAAPALGARAARRRRGVPRQPYERRGHLLRRSLRHPRR